MANQSESIAKLAAAMVAAHAEMENPTKDRANSHHKYKYATLEALLEVAKPVLAKHRLTVVQMPAGTGDVPTLVTAVVHESGEFIRSEMPLTLLKPESVRGPQALGSAITYARRYALQSVLGVTAEDDDDGGAGSAPPKQQKPAQQQPQQERTAAAKTYTDKQMDDIINGQNKNWPWVVSQINKRKGTAYRDGTEVPEPILFAFFAAWEQAIRHPQAAA